MHTTVGAIYYVKSFAFMNLHFTFRNHSSLVVNANKSLM